MEVKQLIRTAQYEALKAVNREMINLYWAIGQMSSCSVGQFGSCTIGHMGNWAVGQLSHWAAGPLSSCTI